MAQFYRCVIQGRSLAKPIVNVLYYGDIETGSVPILSSEMQAVGDDVRLGWIANALPLLSATYQLERVRVDVVNQFNEVISPFPVDLQASGQGGVAGAQDSRGLATIWAFQSSPALVWGTTRVPKRSYIVLGPMVSTQVNDDGAAVLNSTAAANLRAWLQSTVEGQQGLYAAVRIGRRSAGGIAGAGSVVNVITRPFIRPRKSRFIRSTGEA